MKQILQGKNCLITGSTGGLGKENAKEFAKNGCNLFLTGRNNKKLNSLKDELEKNQIKINYLVQSKERTHKNHVPAIAGVGTVCL